MVLHPLEFTDCFYDSPYFRENLHSHETELNRTSKAIKSLTKNCEDIFECARALSKAQRTFADNLVKFKFECIGTTETEDEQVITESCEKMGLLLASIEDTRDRLMDKAQEQFIQPLRDFRKKEIEEAMEMKRKFDRQSLKYSTCVDRFLGVTTKKPDDVMEEAETAMNAEQKAFLTNSMEYVLSLQRIQEKKKFQFVETLLTLIQGWKTFHHEAYDLTEDFQPFMVDLGHRLQLTREHFVANFDSAEKLMRKLLTERNSLVAMGSTPSAAAETTIFKRRNPVASRQGYLFLMDKKPWGTTWNKVYCMYKKQNKVMTLVPYQPGNTRGISATETFVVTACVRRTTDSIEKRWCFDVTAQEKSQHPLTFQAMGKKDRDEWLSALEGKEPDYAALGYLGGVPKSRMEEADAFIQLNDVGRVFVTRCIQLIESKGVDTHEGLYRLVGSAARVKKLIHQYFLGGQGLPPNAMESLQREAADVKILTSALKQYLRALPEPLLTFELYPAFVAAVRLDSKRLQIDALTDLVQYRLPTINRELLFTLIQHLIKVADASDTNLMNKTNLGVCFGPTLLRSEEETMASIMDIKFCNIVVEHFIEYFDEIFRVGSSSSSAGQASPFPGSTRPRPAGRSPVPPRKDKKPAPTPPKRPAKFPTTPSSSSASTGAAATQQLTPLKTGSNQQQQQQHPPASPIDSTPHPPGSPKNPFEDEDEVYSPITDPSNPFYDEIPSSPAPPKVDDESAVTPPPPRPPTPPSKRRLYPSLSRSAPGDDQDDDNKTFSAAKMGADDKVEAPSSAKTNANYDDNSGGVYCVDRQFRTEAPAPSCTSAGGVVVGETTTSSSRSSTSSVEVEIYPPPPYSAVVVSDHPPSSSDNDRNNNIQSSNDNNNNLSSSNAVSNHTYCSIVPTDPPAAAVVAVVDTADVQIRLNDDDTSKPVDGVRPPVDVTLKKNGNDDDVVVSGIVEEDDEDSDGLYEKIGDLQIDNSLSHKVDNKKTVLKKKPAYSAYDQVGPNYAAVMKFKKLETATSTTTTTSKTTTIASVSTPEIHIASTTEESSSSSTTPLHAADSETDVIRRDKPQPVATPRRRPLSQSRPPLPPLPTASSALDVSSAGVGDKSAIGGAVSNLSLDDGIYENVMAPCLGSGGAGDDSSSSLATSGGGYATLSPQAPSRSRRSLHKLNAIGNEGVGGTGGGGEQVAGIPPPSPSSAGVRDPKETWVPMNQR